jgi:ubiquinone/menaquinone biosynthesis C-methylase UbiE
MANFASRIEWRLRYTAGKASAATSSAFWSLVGALTPKRTPPEVEVLESESRSDVDLFWGEHTVNSKPFKAAGESERYLAWRSEIYPLFTEFMQLYGSHDDQVVLDYGCGPGNDLVGFALYSRAKEIIGIDISEKALELARQRLALHAVPPERIRLLQSSDTIVTIPLETNSVDYIHCAGVLHHTSHPELLLAEFQRILKPGGEACVMVYNRDSVWLHLFVSYKKLIIENAFPGQSAHEIFHRTVDVEADGTGNCPLARCYRAEDFIALCESEGFRAEYVGAYLTDVELKALQEYEGAALTDPQLAEEHKEFLRNLSRDERGYPKYRGMHAGLGGVYRLFKN